MATNFMSLDKKQKENKKTIFTHIVEFDKKIKETSFNKPEDYENVLYIGYDNDYGDVFKVWNEEEENNFIIFFGTKGDEFDK